ncbi:MAG: decaprenyl-phosphate phosphoribosyltransferase [Clostridiaceae bacterium]|nr:decaprenyl-phosphate phosphoribosyltransferase [Clostridiaceae bacterium]
MSVKMNKSIELPNKIKYFIIAMRPKQWIKNGFVFAGLVFSRSFLQVNQLVKAVYAFAIFSIISGVVYIINDIIDRDKDILHPLKAKRPIASGKLKPIEAIIPGLILLCICLLLSYNMDFLFFIIILSYFLLILLYSLFLKHIVILDVVIISMGFVLRTLGGTVVIRVEISPWLIMCTTFLALFLALSKRKNELLLLSDNAALHRKNLGEYTTDLIDQMLPVITSATIMSYSLYTFTSGKSHYMMFTIPFVIYGVFRYQYVVSPGNEDANPENVLLGDIPSLVNILLWGIISMIIVYFFY